ncbi:MTMR9 [Mytilus edulis]|uniref:MTMR9 n=1 Tax=Mytilus edulis TaxID=6550 RepID=A0A8S3TCW6_MYTED|nr:MTMR9 [Mytilus edulis]
MAEECTCPACGVKVRLVYSFTGFIIGLSVFIVFGIKYENWNAALWGLISGASVLVHGSEGFDTTQDYLPVLVHHSIIELLLLYFTGALILVHGSEGFDTTQDYLPWASVLVHGSEGFDTTLQVTSLVQLILDHDCRTINGFEALVEREWLQGGHPFADRCSKSAFAITKQRSESPIFLLFLDCVWQIWQQFPCSFEFNEEFLVLLFEHTNSSQFGTFLCNNEKERKECKLSSRTVSLWTYLARPEVLQKYLNPMYDPNPRVIWPSVAPQSLVLWSGLYQRSIIDQSKQKEAWQEVSKIREYDKELRSKVTKLRRQLASLEREALGVGLILPSELGVDCIPE